jgi:hypothetical protein
MPAKGGKNPWVGGRMRELVAIVVASPGITMFAAAERLGPGATLRAKPTRHLARGSRQMRQCNYKTIDRAIIYGLIRVGEITWTNLSAEERRKKSQLFPWSGIPKENYIETALRLA